MKSSVCSLCRGHYGPGRSGYACFGAHALPGIWLSLRVPLMIIVSLIKHDMLVIYKEMLTGENAIGKF
jgi:hypothetical protein